jgi:hypothetical protein
MKRMSEKEIQQDIKKKRRDDLAMLATEGIPIDQVIGLIRLMLSVIHKRPRRGKSEKELYHFAKRAKDLSKRLTELSGDLQKFVQTPTGVKPNSGGTLGRTLCGMAELADWLKEESRTSGTYLKKKGRKNSDLEFYLLGPILQDNRKFHRWDELSRLLRTAGEYENDTTNVSEDFSPGRVRLAAYRYLRVGAPLWIMRRGVREGAVLRHMGPPWRLKGERR